MKILIAEDSEDQAHLLKFMLAPYGDVAIARDGVEAVAAFEEALGGEEPFDLLCLDIMMPKMDGIEALEKIRAMENERGIGGEYAAKAVMLTAKEDDETIRSAILAGCEGYVFKTAGKKKFLAKLQELGLID